MTKWGGSAKGLAAFLAALVSGWALVTSDASPAGSVATKDELIGLVMTSLLTGLFTWLIPNAVPSVNRTPPSQP